MVQHGRLGPERGSGLWEDTTSFGKLGFSTGFADGAANVSGSCRNDKWTVISSVHGMGASPLMVPKGSELLI